MGNTCVGPSFAKAGFLQSVSAQLWRAKAPEQILQPEVSSETPHSEDDAAAEPTRPDAAPKKVHDKPPSPVKMAEEEEEPKKPQIAPSSDVKRLHSIRSCVLGRKTENLKDLYDLGRKLGQGQFGTTYLCVEKATGKEYACKSIAKRKLTTEEDVEDVRREIQIMHHLAGHPNVISIKGAYEDNVAVHVVMELCAGGELFDRIIARGHYTERQAASLARVIVGVVEACHSLGVTHRDLKPENFLFVDQREESPLKTIDFGLSIFFKPGHPWVQIDGVAPDKPLDSAVLTRLKQFSAMNKLKKMALRVIAESLSEEEIAGLKEMFKMIDTDNSGSITFEELKDGLKKVGANLMESEIYALMEAADIDNSGTIDYREFIAATLHLNKVEKEDHLCAAFSYFDKDGSGYITQDELQQVCEEFGIEDVRLEEMIREVDQDDVSFHLCGMNCVFLTEKLNSGKICFSSKFLDGRIDYNEFVAMVQKGNPVFGKKSLQNNFSGGLREVLKLG